MCYDLFGDNFMKSNKKKTQDFKTIDKITKIFTICISVILGAIFLGACAYMLKLISESDNVSCASNKSEIQNMSLVNM